MELTPLNTKQALRLYSLLRPHVNGVDLQSAILLDILDTIIRDMVSSGNSMKYGEAISLMTGLDQSVLVQKQARELLELFMEGIVVNQLPDLIAFGDRLGLNV